DRDFLDSVVGQILNIENQHATLYSGNYSAFERIRAERLAHQQSQYEKQQREVQHIRSFIDRFRAKASKARQAQSRIKALERMEFIAPAHVDSPFHFSLLEPEKLPTPLIRVDQASVGYGKTTVLSGLRLSLSPGDRIGLLGPNGAGKSTLIKMLAGTLEMQSGEFTQANDLETGYFAQHQVEQLDPRRSPLEHFFELAPKARELDLRNYLGGFGFSGDTVFMPTGPFSGGEKSRLALALLVFHRPNLILLDEPTNHLDLEMRQALATALQDFSGAMVIVSHDRHLLRVTTDQLWLVHGGEVNEFDGSLDDYPAWLSAQSRSSGNSLRSAAPEKKSVDRKEQKRIDAERRDRLRPLNRRLEKAEAAMSALQVRKKDIELRLADTALYDASKKQELLSVLDEQADVNWKLAKEEANWLEATEELERAK
ncbi:MAG: ATP-binding cassette domain-containing protein, partial [Woeseiaceae bacterium]